MNQVFILNACDILGNTEKGLKGSQITSKLKAFAYEYNVDIPYPSVQAMQEKGCPNKRKALYENVIKFNEEQQYMIIKTLCLEPNIANNKEIKELKAKLYIQYGKEYDNQGEEIKEVLNDISEHWLDKYPRSYRVYNDAMIKYKNNIFNRNILDDLRLSLELLVKDILKNEQSLENQHNELSKFLSKNNSQFFINLFNSLLKSYETYNNNMVKHNKEENSANDIEEQELNFIVQLTNIVMRFLVENDKSK